MSRTPARSRGSRAKLRRAPRLTWVLLALLATACGSLLLRPLLGRGKNAPVPQVQVLNGSGTAELAQQVADRLRERGLDVVQVGNADAADYPETLVLLRRGHLGVARQVAAALGRGRVMRQDDPTLLVDVTVILGRDAAPP